MYCFGCGRLFQQDDAFCGSCGAKKRCKNTLPTNATEKDIIEYYHSKGYQYQAIVFYMDRFHGISMSIRTLKRRLKESGLRKKQVNIDEWQIREIIRNEIQGPGSLLGYRGMQNRLRTTYGVQVPRDFVMLTLKELDPEGTAERKSRRLKRQKYHSSGPDAIWHIDGYDKLKPYGLPIHGCVDGFSRKIIWLNVCKSNNDPSVPASYYIKEVQSNSRCPKTIRTDCGTENGMMAAFQCTLTNDENSHRYGKSIHNQRIENWWSHQRRGYTSWLIRYFKNMVNEGTLDVGNNIQMECIWFVHSHLLQTDSDNVKNEWNNHYIRKCRNGTLAGIPNQLYDLPELKGFKNRGVYVNEGDLNTLIHETRVLERAERVQKTQENSLTAYFFYVVRKCRLDYPPKDWIQAKQMYVTIMDHFW